MKIAYIFAGVIVLHALFPCAVSSQGSYQGPEKSACIPSSGVSIERLGLTDEQRGAVDKIEKAYDDEIDFLQGKLMSKRLELQSLFSNPEIDEDQIRGRAREVFDLQDECRRMAVDYRLEVRRLLTPEQLRNWCAPGDWSFPGTRRK